MTDDEDRILRGSVPERYRHCTSPIGAVQNYISELEKVLEILGYKVDGEAYYDVLTREENPDDR